MEKNTPTAVIVGFTEHQVIIYCPHCFQLHYHGIVPGIDNEKIIGKVSSHCFDKSISDPEGVGYDIPAFDTYDPVKAVELEKIAKENKKIARRQRLRRRYS